MNTQQQDVQEVPELKSERVQDGLAAGAEAGGEVPFGVELKSERVQDGFAAGSGKEEAGSSLGATFTSFQPASIEMSWRGAVIKFHSAAAVGGNGTQTAGRVAG